MNTKKRVVITGLGIVSPFGVGQKPFFEGIHQGTAAFTKLDEPWAGALASQVAARVPGFDPLSVLSPKECGRVPRIVPLTLAAAREALAQAGLSAYPQDLEKSRSVGVLLGSGGGGIEFAEKQYEEYFGNGNAHVTPYCVSSSFVGMLSSEISIALGLRGMSHVLSTGCTSSTDAMGYAFQMIRSGFQKILLTGGADACITRGLMAGFSRMKVTSTHYNENPSRASRPFDRERDGFVLGEGAWIFVFEDYDHARERGAEILAEVCGYGSTCDAYHRVMASADGVESARAMTLALEDAGIRPDAVQYINLHGTSTQMNDRVETLAVKLAFQKHAWQVSSSATKSMIGHPQGACGAAGASAALLSLRESVIHPTINYEFPDELCDLNYTPNTAVRRDVDYAVCNTIAFGSKNSSLVLKRWQEK